MGKPADEKATLAALFKGFLYVKKNRGSAVIPTCRGVVTFTPGIFGGVNVTIDKLEEGQTMPEPTPHGGA